jgi:fibronectin type 3 domain-containing protein
MRSWFPLVLLCLASAICGSCRSSDTTDAAHHTGPANLKTAGDCDGITISWEAQPKMNVYTLLRSERMNDPKPPVIQQVKAPAYRDLTATAGATYYYWVKTEAGISFPASGTRTDLPPIPSDVSAHGDGITVEVTWSGTAQDYDFQQSVRRLGETKWIDQEVVQLRPAKQKASFGRFFNHVHEFVLPMRFRVRAVNECGESDWTEWKPK